MLTTISFIAFTLKWKRSLDNRRNIFVYGTLRQGEYNNILLENAKFKGMFSTVPEYELRNFGVFPGLMSNGSTSVKGEVYEVDDETLTYLDYHEGHPTFYCRTTIKLKGHTDEVEAYLISEHPRYHKELPIIHSGDWKERQSD